MNLDRKLMAYAAGAAAAVWTARSADAAIIYNTGEPFGVADTVPINFNKAGDEEFNIGHERTGTDEGQIPQPNTDRVILKEKTAGTTDYVTNFPETNNVLIAPLAPGTLIGPDSTYGAQYNNNVGNRIVDEDADDNSTVDDPFLTNFRVDDIVGNPEYIGVRFLVDGAGDPRYGWIGIDITNSDDLTGQITGFAYDDTGAPIEAGAVPEPGSGLALLAAGAASLLRRRRP